MAETQPTTPYTPIGEEPSGVATLIRRVLPIALLAVIALSFVAPETVRRLVPGVTVDPNAVRFFAILLLFVLVAVSSARQTKQRNEARRAMLLSFAASVGGRAVDRPVRATPSGWEGGMGVEYDVQGRPARLASDRGRQSVYTYRLTADIVLSRDFQLQVVPGGRAMRFVLSKTFLLPALTIASKGGASVRVDARGDGAVDSGAAGSPALGIERFRFLVEEPVTTGDAEFDRAYLIKSSDRGAARDLVCDPSVRAAFTALTQAGSGFQMGIESKTPGGPGTLVISTSPASASPALFAAMDGALRATLATLERLGLIEGGTRVVA